MPGDRANPFDNIEESNIENNIGAGSFSVKTQQRMTPEQIAIANETAEKHGFQSSKTQPVEPIRQQRRHRTGRNQQLNIKATDQTVTKFYRIADEANITLGEVLERALTALEEANAKKE